MTTGDQPQKQSQQDFINNTLSARIEEEWNKVIDKKHLPSELLVQYRLSFYVQVLIGFLAKFKTHCHVSFDYESSYSPMTADTVRFPADIIKEIDDFSDSTQQALFIKGAFAQKLMDYILIDFQTPFNNMQSGLESQVFFGEKNANPDHF